MVFDYFPVQDVCISLIAGRYLVNILCKEIMDCGILVSVVSNHHEFVKITEAMIYNAI